MPAPPNDDLFKRMFASFVARKTRASPAPAAAAPAPRPPYVDRPPDALRKVATDFNGRTFSPHGPPPVDASVPRQGQSLHVPPSNAGAQPNDRTGLHALFPFRSHAHAAEPPRAPSPQRRTQGAAPKTVRSSKSSKGSKGSKGSEKQVSASTEDAPPRKRTRTHPHAQPPLQRSQSAHAGSLHASNRSKSEKARAGARYNLPPSHALPGGAGQSQADARQAGPAHGGAAARPSAASKSFPCDKCSATFAQKGQLSRHTRRVHEKLRPHGCEYCGRLFGARSDKARHVTIVHKKVREFPCDRCGFQFQAKTHLEAHVRTVHDGERPYRCDQCGFSFGLRSNLLTHERAVHYREAKWNCSECDAAFNRKHDMFRHRKLMHDLDSPTGTGTGSNAPAQQPARRS